MTRLRIAATTVCLLLMLVPAVVATVGRHVDDAPVPDWFGARAEVLSRLPAPSAGGTWHFAVLGDIQQGLAAHRASLELLREWGGISFAVVCGDLVNRPSLPHYGVLFASMEDRDPGIPVLTVPGNHDHAGLYEKRVGPRFWEATVGPDRIVGVDTSELESPGPFLDRIVKSLAKPARHRFVFLHRPVARPGRTRVKFGPLARVLAEGDVTAVFAGHLHGFESFEHEGVCYVTNGRGGDLMGTTRSDAAIGIVTVTPDGVTVEEVEVGARSEVLPILLSGMVTRIWAPFGAFATFGIALLLGLAAVLSTPSGGRRIAILAAVFLALPSAGLPLLILLACLLVFIPASVFRRRVTEA